MPNPNVIQIRDDEGNALYPITDSSLIIGVDNAPTQNSTNLVKSGGVYTELAKKYEKPSGGIPASDLASGVIPDAVEANPTVPSGTTPASLSGLKIGSAYYDIEAGGGTVPTISTDIQADKASTTKTASPSAVYNEVHPAVVTSQPAGGFAPNILYALGEISGSVTFALATPADANIVNHYYWTFDTGASAPTITWPAGLSWMGGSALTVDASKHYEISVLSGVALFIEV